MRSSPAAPTSSPAVRWAAWGLVLFMGAATTLYHYDFFSGQHLDQLQPLLRAEDPGYLPHDFFVDASSAFTERRGYVNLLSALVPPFSRPVLFFLLTLLGNLGIATATFLTGRDLFGSPRAGLVAAAMVMSIKTFKLGYAPHLFVFFLIPSHLIMPLILVAVWQGIRQRPVATALLCGVASLIHPLVGPGVGGLLLLQQLIVLLVNRRRQFRPYLLLLGGGVFILVCAAYHVWPYLQRETGVLEKAVFFEVLAFRSPHHDIPSYFFRWYEFLSMLAFMGATALAWHHWRITHPQRRLEAQGMVVLTGLLALLCLSGYLFVEVWPVRLMITIRAFRFLILVKYLGLVLIGGAIAALWEGARRPGSLPALLLAVLSPVTMFVAMALQTSVPLPRQLAAWQARLRRPLPFTVLLVALFVVLHLRGWLRSMWILWGLYALLLALATTPRRTYAALVLGIAGVAFLLVVPRTALPPPVASTLGEAFTIRWDYSDYPQPVFELSRYVRRHLPETSLLLVPPQADIGVLRLEARRALVVDLYAVPRWDAAMAEWRDRILTLYTPPGTAHLPSIDSLPRYYRRLSPERLAALGARYGATHAVLYTGTPTPWPVLYANDKYQLVALPGQSAP